MRLSTNHVPRRISAPHFRAIKYMGMEEILSAPRSPWLRTYAERVISTIHCECLDHVIVFNGRPKNSIFAQGAGDARLQSIGTTSLPPFCGFPA